MQCRARSRTYLISLAFWALVTGSASARSEESADVGRALIARDVCLGVAANFAHGSPGTDISFQSGKFTVRKAGDTLTVFEGAAKVADIPGFDYSTYSACLDSLISGFERTQRADNSKSHIEAFLAGYELSGMLQSGICLRSAAMGGFWYGDTQNFNAPVQMERLRQFGLSTSKSVARRLRKFSKSPIDFDLGRDMQFFQYYPDKPIPFFDPTTIQDQIDTLNDAVPDSESDYVQLGELVGRMNRIYLYYGVFSAILPAAQYQGGERAVRAVTYLPPTLQCLGQFYTNDTNKFRRSIDDLNLSDVQAAPRLTSFSLNGGGPDQNLFDNRVTSSIRKALQAQ